MLRAFIFGAILAAGAYAEAGAGPDESRLAPCSRELHHAFDFWIGDWEVTDLEGKPVGRNAISTEESGCLLVERWTSASGGTGQSYNFVDPATGKWRQLWVSSGALIDYSGGITATGSMKLDGEISYQTGGPKMPFTGEWTLNGDGSVTQHFEQFNSETAAWDDWFTGIYRRVGAAE